jgi:myo-inositol 2-dehydrogenase / D-chiro-inositol 1-dehydrogenase
MTSREARIGMVSWAHVHAQFRARALSEIPGARVVAISDDNPARGAAAAAEFGADFVPDWGQLVRRDDIDVVMVHSENARHPDQVVEAARAGKHVFCEKPIATRVEDAERMVRAVEEAGVDGTAAFVSRFSKEASRAAEIVKSGAIGEVLFTRSLIGLEGLEEIGLSEEMSAWMADPELGGGGAWIDEGSHAVDLLRWLVGDITEVGAVMANRAKPRLDGEDVAVVSVRFASGALGELVTCWSMNADIGMRNHLEIYGRDGTMALRATDPNPRVEVFRSRDVEMWRGWSQPHIRPAQVEPHDYSSWPPHLHHYKREVASYINRYHTGQHPYGPTLRDGLECLKVIAAGYASGRDRGALVAI